MSKKLVKPVLQYTLSLAVAIGILWYVLSQVELEKMLGKLHLLNYWWIGASVFFGLLSYLLRAYRWNLLLAPIGYRPGFVPTFLATMVGYLANLLLPRFGEVVRCGMLKRSDAVPVSASLGTVLVDRAFDLLALLSIVGMALFLEFDVLKDFLAQIFQGEGTDSSSQGFFFYYLLAGVVLVAGLLWVIYRLYRVQILQHALYQKASGFVRELLAGVMSVRKLESPVGFWLSTILIWVMYYLMSYLIVFSLPATSDIDFIAGLSILAMGGIGMAAPVQGGLGTYHLLVSGVLMLYGAEENEAVLLAFVLHTSQTLLVIVVGSISFLISMLRKKAQPITSSQHV
ncbi:lysylphosphatidylglycerol synthase transmembrane domain-containing protein [Nafulsella turpanensis]|uniref:lysylphosphatidylglycerol synthase transmembrane domain-containing protein n=1 Tax=Nafulsella turpanensis TaxID=1265690 RepID=UPI000347D47B|nr:lysylphosphatidylglycerol synthase transmembrane domain-containing protein [Nafulsella turpanensis]